MFRFFSEDIDQEPRGLSRQQLQSLERQSTECSQEQVGQTCAICLESLEPNTQVINLDCSHFFHKNCILRWYNDHSTCPICRSGDSDNQREVPETHTVRLPLQQLLMMSTQVSLVFYYPNRLRQVTCWNSNSTIVEVLQYITKSCSSQNANIQMRNDDHIFKTTESFSYLNQTLLMLGITNGTEFIISFF